MAITANGFIATEDDSSDFLTKTESESYVSHVCKAGALIIGRRTYNILSLQPEFQAFLKAKIKIVAVSHSEFMMLDKSHAIAHSPQEALTLLKGFKEVILAGGSILNTSFLEQNLVDEIYLDVEPTVMGKGIPLFQNKDFEKKLEFISSKNISKNEIQLHYKIIK